MGTELGISLFFRRGGAAPNDQWEYHKLAPNQGEIEQNVIGEQENEGVSVRDMTVEDTEGVVTREGVSRSDQGTSRQ